MIPQLSVLVVTHDRPAHLRRVLEDLQRQTLPARRFEVLVSDDGSEPPAEQALAGLEPAYQLRVLRGPNAGPAVARNRALELVRAPLILFLNDDFRLAPDALEAHLHRHAALGGGPCAVMGTFLFTPELRADPLHRLPEDLRLFGSHHLPADRPLQPLAFWTGNLSVPADEVRAVGGFDESLREPSGDDVDLGYRLERQRRVRLWLCPAARAWHDHRHRLEDWWHRWQMWGRARRALAHKHGDPLFWFGRAADRHPSRWPAAYAQLQSQAPLVAELTRWLERLAAGAVPPQDVYIEGCGPAAYRLPQDAELLMSVALRTSFPHAIRRAFWEAPPGWQPTGAPDPSEETRP